MKKEIIKRTVEEAEYIINTNSTIRETARKFNVSKSTVHKDISARLKEIDYEKYKIISIIVKKHLELRHIKGGEATKNKYKL